jgi:hypothetical protein
VVVAANAGSHDLIRVFYHVVWDLQGLGLVGFGFMKWIYGLCLVFRVLIFRVFRVALRA